MPFIVRWPGQVVANQVYRHPVSALDVLPTALAAAGIAVKATAGLDGKNLLPLLQGKVDTPPHEALFWRFGEQYAVRSGDYKLLRHRGEIALYDLKADLSEAQNLLQQKPDVALMLQMLYEAWEKQMIDPKWQRKPFER